MKKARKHSLCSPGELFTSRSGRGLSNVSKSFSGTLADKPYPGGMVRSVVDDPASEPATRSALIDLYNRLQQMTGSGRVLDESAPAALAFHIGHDVMLSTTGELALLQLSSEQQRQRYLLTHLAKRLGV